MKKSVELNTEKYNQLKLSFNNSRDPETDWQNLLKGIIEQVMDDYVRLQHPSRRDHFYLKEAFCSAIACLWDEDYEIEWPINDKENKIFSFREVLAERFGIENLSKDELHKINMGIIQNECINNAKKYWIDKQLSILEVGDFFVFDGRAFSIWKTNEESSVDYDNMIINLESIDDPKEQAEAFLKICFEIISYYNNIKIKPEVIEQLSLGWYQVLRMNNCFK